MGAHYVVPCSLPAPSFLPLQALQSLSLYAPFSLLARFAQDLGRSFGGLKQLSLRAHSKPDFEDTDNEWSEEDAVLGPALLCRLSPRLESLKLARFCEVHLDQPAPVETGKERGSAAPPPLLPALTHLTIHDTCTVVLDAPLPRLAQLDTLCCSDVSLAGEQLSLPQLTRLQLSETRSGVRLRCSAMPALERLESGGCELSATDSFAALGSVTHMRLAVAGETLDSHMKLVAGGAATLHSIDINVSPYGSERMARMAAHALAAAGAAQLTQLVRGCSGRPGACSVAWLVG